MRASDVTDSRYTSSMRRNWPLTERTGNRNEHLDAYISVSGIRGLFNELQMRGAEVIKPLEERPWACIDFYVEDPDGYILCFSEQNA